MELLNSLTLLNMKKIILFLFVFTSIHFHAQQRNEEAWNKAKEAIKLMEEGKIDESIDLLKECEKTDSKDYTYPYEMAYAYILKKDYKTAIKILNKTKKYKGITNQVYQLLGNCYSYSGEPEKAIKEYEEGMKKFPNSGNLYLEKGNIYLFQEKYNEAIQCYEDGIKVDPMYPSNYYRLAKLFFASKDKLSGLIYGELFMNIERTTKRTTEMSKLLYDTYTEVIKIDGDNASIHFCELTIDLKDVDNGKIEMPFCGIFGSHFILATIMQKEVNLKTLSEMRLFFINSYFKKDYEKHPNLLFEYHNRLLQNDLLEAYNFYLFQVGSSSEFNEWKNKNESTYTKFTEWYVQPENIIEINQKNKFIR